MKNFSKDLLESMKQNALTPMAFTRPSVRIHVNLLLEQLPDPTRVPNADPFALSHGKVQFVANFFRDLFRSKVEF